MPALVNGNTAYLGIVGAAGETTIGPLSVNSLAYTVNTAPANPSLSTYTTTTAAGSPYSANPTFSPPAGAYSSTQTVTISSATSGAYICYAVASSVPSLLPQPNNYGGCQSGTLYSGPVSVPVNNTLYAIAGTTYTLSHGIPSALIAGAYTGTGSSSPASTPTFSPTAGTYTGSQSVAISTSSSGAIICYNTTASPATNGTTGCGNGTLYSGPVTVSSSETLYAVAGGTGFTDSSAGSAAYVININAATPTFSPAAGAYTSAQPVTISDATSGATIYYTTNGTTPTTSSTPYTGPITVSSTETLEAIAAATGDTNSAVASATFTITPVVSTPAFSLAAGSYTSAQSVTISDATSGATIYYTTNGTTPTTSSTQYTGPITVNSTETLEAIAVATGDTNSAVASATYTITPTVSRPAASIAAGRYTSA
jgi:Chitobiase/beta-hexosaminidase C-terminal domain